MGEGKGCFLSWVVKLHISDVSRIKQKQQSIAYLFRVGLWSQNQSGPTQDTDTAQLQQT